MRELTNDECLDLFADIVEPCSVVLADKEVVDKFMNSSLAAGVACAVKRHKSEVIQILAATDGVPAEEYKVNPFTMPIKLFRLFSLPEMKELFGSAGQKMQDGSSGSHTESTQEGAH